MLSKSERGEQNVTKEAQQTKKPRNQETNPSSKTDLRKQQQSKARNPLATGDFPGLQLARQLAFLMGGSDGIGLGSGWDRNRNRDAARSNMFKECGCWVDAFVEFVIVANKLWADGISAPAQSQLEMRARACDSCA